MKGLVLDCSVAMAWCFEDETDAFTEAALSAVVAEGAVVPSLWPLEVVNVLLVAERKKRLTGAQATMFLGRLLALPVEIEGTPSSETWPRLHALARTYSLSSYDTAYLDLAARRGIPLASCDKALRQAARTAGVTLYGASDAPLG